MSLDPSLKSASSLSRHRNVLTRAERLEQLTGEEKWNDTKSPLGLPKVGHRKAAIVKAEKAAVEGDAAAAPVAGAKGAAPAAKGAAPAAKAAAPAAGAKGAGPAAKAAAPAAKKK